MNRNSNTLSIYLLLAANIVLWGVAWPISKIGLVYMPPIWYAVIRLIIGLIVMVAVLQWQGKFTLPKRQDFPLIFSIGFLQMGMFLMLINYGLVYVGAGRSAILAYSTPLWVTPIASIFFGERLTRFKLIGLFAGLTGIILLFSPWGFDWSDRNVIIGNMILLLSAVTWAGAMIHTRFGKWHSEPASLVPWQLLVAIAVTLPVAMLFEPHPHFQWNNTLISTLLFNGILATAFCYFASITVSKNLPIVVTSLTYLTVPITGILSSAVMLGEKLTLIVFAAMFFIIGGLACVAIGSVPPKSSKTDDTLEPKLTTAPSTAT